MSWLKRTALAVALLQAVLATFTSGGTLEFWMATVLGWAAALQLARADVARDSTWPARLLGAALVVAGLLELLPLQYRAAHRLAPLCAGLGVALLGGPGFARAQARALATLLWPLLLPPPVFLRERLLDFSAGTAAAAALGLRASGFAVVRDGTRLLLPASELIVLPGCSGLSQILALLALALLALALFPTSRLQKAWVLGSAVLVGFASNAARIAALSVLADQGQIDRFQQLHEGSTGQLCTVASAALALALWWPLLLKAPAPLLSALPRPQNS